MEEHETFKNKFHQKVIFQSLEDKKQTTCVYNYTIQNTYNEKKILFPSSASVSDKQIYYTNPHYKTYHFFLNAGCYCASPTFLFAQNIDLKTTKQKSNLPPYFRTSLHSVDHLDSRKLIAASPLGRTGHPIWMITGSYSSGSIVSYSVKRRHCGQPSWAKDGLQVEACFKLRG